MRTTRPHVRPPEPGEELVDADLARVESGGLTRVRLEEDGELWVATFRRD